MLRESVEPHDERRFKYQSWFKAEINNLLSEIMLKSITDTVFKSFYSLCEVLNIAKEKFSVAHY